MSVGKDTQLWIEDPTASVYTSLEALSVNATGFEFTASGVDYWSSSRELEVVVMPNGVVTGGNVTPGTANDTVDVAELNVWLNGVQMTISASAAEAVTRGSVNGFIRNAITIDSLAAVTVIAGTESTAFSDVIGAVGGPPYIPADSILIAIVSLTNTTAGAVLSTEISQSRGRNLELALYPTWDISHHEGVVRFSSPLPTIHTGDIPKPVYASYASVKILGSFTKLLFTDNAKVPETTYAGTKVMYHDNKRLTDVAEELTDCTFDMTFKDSAGIGSNLANVKGDKLYLLIYPDQFKPPRFLCPPAIVSFERDAIAASVSNLKVTVTMLAEHPAIELQI